MARRMDPILKHDKTVEAVAKLLLKVQDKTHMYMGEILDDWLQTALAALTQDEDKYMKVVNRYDKKKRTDIMTAYSQAFGALLLRAQEKDYTDVLGPIYMNLASYDGNHMGQFFTPAPVAEMMAMMNMCGLKLPDDRLFTIQEPCCGSGVMLLAACKALTREHGKDVLNRVFFHLNDLDLTCCHMAGLQLAVYDVPNWIVTRGNALVPASLQPILQRGLHPTEKDFQGEETVNTKGIIEQDAPSEVNIPLPIDKLAA